MAWQHRKTKQRDGSLGGKARVRAQTPEQRSATSRLAGLSRAANLTPERMSEIAAMGGRAKWAKARLRAAAEAQQQQEHESNNPVIV